MTIEHLYFSLKFYDDYANLDDNLKSSVDSFVKKLAKGKDFPNSAQLHKAKSTEYYIAYVRVSKPHIRTLAFIDGTTVTLDRLVYHDNMDVILKELAKA